LQKSRSEKLLSPVLARVTTPADLKQLSLDELEQLCVELRTDLWETITSIGGHLAASMGVVELSVALHYVYDTPRDKLVWDVGHQGYIHKMLTGRRDRLKTIRQYKGLSGFLKHDESEYDAFGAGHASTAISAAYGMAVARDLKGEDFNVVAVIGDGGLTGGLAYEALCNAGPSGRNFTVILNDNGMSISRNVGAVPKFLARMETNPTLSKVKDEIWNFLGESPVGARKMQKMAGRLEASLKTLISPGMLFEDLGFQYFGPFDGHNLREVVEILQNIKSAHKHPALIHVSTMKGKGQDVAEADPIKYHAVKGIPAKVEPKTDSHLDSSGNMAYMDIFGEQMIRETARDQRVVAITAAMKEGTGLVKYAATHPDNFFDVGIAEGHAVTFAAGMATEGLRPVAAIYSTFLQRAFDHLVHDCALPHLPVLFALDRGGLVGEDGPTHHGCLDLAYLSCVQGMVVTAPRSGSELRNLIRTGLLYEAGPFAIRYPRDKAPDIINWDSEPQQIPVGTWEVLREGRKLLVLAVGTMVEAARRAAASEELNVTIVNCRFVKPIDESLLSELLQRHESVLTIEEGVGWGGFGAQIAGFLKQAGHNQPFAALHLPDHFIEHGSREQLLELAGLSDAHIAEAMHRLYKGEIRSGTQTKPGSTLHRLGGQFPGQESA
jgi:1-deoxy-D-xylulose-5-phosphate synthase